MYGESGLPTNDERSRAARWVSTVSAITGLPMSIVLVMERDGNVQWPETRKETY